MDDMKEMNWVVKNRAEEMELQEKYEVPYFVFPAFSKTNVVKHGISTRMGGVSSGHCATMNVSFERDKSEDAVRKNFELLGAAIGFKTDSLVFTRQSHSTNIRMVIGADKGKGFVIPADYRDVDGLITSEPGLTLAGFYADCVPLLFLDPVAKVIGLAHSGWRGTIGKIGYRMVRKMQQVYACKPENILAAIGPSICEDCYEVGRDVIEEFKGAFPKEVWPDIFHKNTEGRYQLDLWSANIIVLEEAGIPREHQSVTNICTCCNPDYLFSHRATHGKRGNIGAFIQLTE